MVDICKQLFESFLTKQEAGNAICENCGIQKQDTLSRVVEPIISIENNVNKFRSYGCISCHSAEKGLSRKNSFAPIYPFDDFTKLSAELKNTKFSEKLIDQIESGKMPKDRELSDKEKSDLIDFIKNIKSDSSY